MKLVAAVVVGVLTLSGAASAAPRGMIEFENKKGVVLFDHKKHERLAQECKVCHERPGDIPDFGRSYAHRVCIGCHEPEVGKMEGPITCEGCHASRR